MDKERENIYQLKPEETELCFHCGLPARKNYSSIIKGEKRNFCCNGCKTACEIIYLVGADSYYQNRECPPEKPVNLDKKNFPWDNPSFRKRYIETSDNINKINFRVDNIHCPSCLWVLEKVFLNLKGIIEFKINFSTSRSSIIWDDNLISLEKIIEQFYAIGYPVVPIEKNDFEINILRKNKNILLALVLSFFGIVSTMFLSEPFYFDYVKDLDNKSANFLRYMNFIVTLPIFIYCIIPFAKGTFNALKYKLFTMDTTIFLGSSLIFIYSTINTFLQKNPIYFDCVNMFLFLIILGRYVTILVQNSIFYKIDKTIKDYPTQARIIKDNEEFMILAEELKENDLVLVKPGETIPSDGTIIEGQTSVNESIITGESRPVIKKVNDKIFGGTFNIDGTFYYKSTKLVSESTFYQIVKLVEELGSKKSEFQNILDRTAHYFVILVLILSLTAFFMNARTNNIDYALLISISIVIVTCPCALGLSSPLAITIGSLLGLKKGIIFKNSEVFEKISKIKHFVFDKTGTITSGKMFIINIQTFNNYTDEEVLQIASSLERYSEHPIAYSIVKEANKRKLDIKKAFGFKYTIGKGIKGFLKGKEIIIGNFDYLIENNVNIQKDYKIDNNLVNVFIAYDKNLIGIITLKDEIRKDIKELIEYLKSKNKKVYILSGDKKDTVQLIANELSIDNFESKVLPEEKLKFINNLQKDKEMVAMIGDGINDAPAMVKADLGITISPRNDLAKLKADLILLGENFDLLSKAISISEKTYKVIKENLTLSLVYNFFAIPFAMTGYITPFIASIIMPLSSLIVLFNSLKLTRNEK